MYKYAGRWYPLTSNGRIIYFLEKSKCENYARFIDADKNHIWSDWFCAFDDFPDICFKDVNKIKLI